MRKKPIFVPTEEIVFNCSYILRILINYGILRGTSYNNHTFEE